MSSTRILKAASDPMVSTLPSAASITSAGVLGSRSAMTSRESADLSPSTPNVLARSARVDSSVSTSNLCLSTGRASGSFLIAISAATAARRTGGLGSERRSRIAFKTVGVPSQPIDFTGGG